MTEVRIDLPKRPKGDQGRPGRLGRLLEAMTFHQQLSLTVALGVLCMALLSSVASAWQASHQTRLNLMQQGLRVTASLAQQSRLALLTGTAENMGEALGATLAFPDVLRVEVHGADGHVLVARGPFVTPLTPASGSQVEQREAPYLLEEGPDTWRFAASVWFMPDHSSPYDVTQPPSQRLGQVQVVLSKATLIQSTTNIFLVNVLSSLVIAVVFLGILRLLSARLTRPLNALSKAMRRAEQGEADVRTEALGPRDLQHMSQAFNRMMAALQERGEELQRHRDHLEELVEARTAELHDAKVRAEIASQAKTDFLTRMSHELRTPLNAIMGYAQILQMDDGLPARHQHILRTIYDSGDHLLKLIVDILDLSRIEAGKTELVPANCALRPLVSGLHDLVRIKAADKQLDFVAVCDEDVPPCVVIDEKRLRQVLLNLLGNALKFTASGQVRLQIRAVGATGDPSRARLRFEVEDTGPGIAAKDQVRIFEPFEQAGDARSRAAGTGLGLAISRQLVRLMGGALQLDSQEGQGSRFWFELDLPVCDEPTSAIPLIRRVQVTGHAGPRRRILIADDVTANRQLLVAMLEPLGFATAEAVDGQDALDQLPTFMPDLVLMDLAMPVLDGLDAIRTLRADARTKDLPVIAITANASAQHREQALAAGASDFIPKPFERDDLLGKLGRLMALTWTHPTPDTGPKPPTR
jgi:signal transduction histidine kinase/ActR/RegA family two-component response regulator